jgi:DNA-directed RNA polymerase beta' subunit
MAKKSSSAIKRFGRFAPLLERANLNELQIRSYNWFVEEGLKELLDEASPIKDHTGKELALHFEGYRFDEPKYDEATARYNDATYEATLRVKVRLEHLLTGHEETQEVYFGDFPIMTKRGTFIINGVERVVVPQLIRSAGVYFTGIVSRGRQLFGAKIMPGRGAWIEFESEYDGALYVKIDRHRKVAVTDLLRVFGASDADIKKTFLESGELGDRSLAATLKKDAAKTIEESYLELYRRLRPGDPATEATAKNLIDGMFKREDRYDLSVVGRFKMNQRLGLNQKKTSRLLDAEDLLAITREVLRLNADELAEEDDIDHLGNRRLKAVGESLQGRLRLGLARMKRAVQDRMSIQEKDTLTPGQLINFRLITAVVKEFFASSQLSQFMNQENPLSEMETKRRISALGPGGLTRERASFEVRDVHRSHYGRICPIQTPEGANIGLINYLAGYARLNDFGFLETPYAKVDNGVVTKKIVWLDAHEEEKYKIAQAGTLRNESGKLEGPIVTARIKGTPGTCTASEVDYLEVDSQQFLSIAAALIPFLQHDDATRALMGSNMQRQAVGSVRPTAPLVGTGMEDQVAFDSGYVIKAEADGEIVEVDATHIKVKYGDASAKGRVVTYPLEKFKRSNNFTCISQRPLVTPGASVKKGDLLADGPSIQNGTLALGQNLLVSFISWEGANFEDAIILSERVVQNDLFTSIHIEEFYADVRDTKLGAEMTTMDIPNVAEEKLRNLDEEGIVRIGAEVRAGDILVGKISPKGESELTSEERLLRAIFGEKARDVKDTSLVLPHGKQGRIVGIKIFDREQGHKLEPGVIRRIQVEVAQLRKVRAGDKLAGRHGNKGVISQVRAVEDMPYLEDGSPVDIILNPLGVASRMNLGQILETHLGWAASKLGYRAITPGLDSAAEEEIREELKKANLPEDGKVKLYDGRSGEPFDQRVTVGQIYMMKLNHLVEDKVHARSIGPYSLITQQPLGGKAQFGGQRFGEMEVWALEGYGARHTLQEMLTIKSDDVMGRSSAYESIIRGEPIKEPSLPASFNVLVNELKALSFNIQQIYNTPGARYEDFDALKISVASPDNILEWSHGEVIKPETINYRTQRPEKDGLFSERIFGPTNDYECYCGKYRRIRYKGVVCDKCGVEVTRASVRRERFGHITLAAPVSHIWFLKSLPSRLGIMLGVQSSKLDRVIYYSAYIVTEVNQDQRKQALIDLERELKGKLEGLDAKKDKQARTDLSDSADRTRSILEDLHPGYVLSEGEYFNLALRFAHVFKAGSGAEAVRQILEKIDLKKEVAAMERQFAAAKKPANETKLLARLAMFKSMIRNNARPEWLIMTVLPVLPPELRPMVALDGGRFATSDLNDLYRRVINRNNRLKKLLEIKAPDVIVKNEKRMLQEAVDALIDNSARFGSQQMSAQRRPLRSLADMLKGKQGRFRQNLLGKRVDYSGRSVIVVGPNLPIDTCGLPKKLALELFRPFVIGEMIKRGLAHNIKAASRLIEQGGDEVWEILETVANERRVLLNRAPTLHRLSIQAFRPVLTESLAIQIPPLVCAAFNADFDGDQMAVHLPLSEAAQREAREIMSAGHNLLKPATGDLVTAPGLDMVLGIYYLTDIDPEATSVRRFLTNDEARIAYDYGVVGLKDLITVGDMQTSVGRIIFNESLTGLLPFVNDTLTKSKIGKIIEQIIDVRGFEAARDTLDRVKLLGFTMATKSGITWAMADLKIPTEKAAIIAAAHKEVDAIQQQYYEGLLTNTERRVRVIRIWEKAKLDLEQYARKVLDRTNPIYQIVNSGARGSWVQTMQMLGMKGLVANPKGESIEIPVLGSYKEGLSVLEYFINTHSARKGNADTALKTANAGYLTRRLVDVAQDVMIRESSCGTKEGLEIHRGDLKDLNQSFASMLYSRTPMEDVKQGNKILARAGEIIDKEKAQLIEASKIDAVNVYSPITCKSVMGMCARCYGMDLANTKPIAVGSAVGVIAAQSIGEPGTQLTMRTFHHGGIAGVDITSGLPRVEELFEARPPKGKAILAETDGTVSAIEEQGVLKTIRLSAPGAKTKKTKAQEYSVPASTLLFVEVGQKVKAGEQLSEGNVDLHELMELNGANTVVRYIVNEVQRVYLSEGASINNKHIEIIVRQMFSRVRIKDAGDSDMTVGDTIPKSFFLMTNRALKAAGKTPAKAEQILLGITKVATTTESFLSAASFQDTSRVLVKAAVEHKIDPLRGLKENVIIGRLIPARALDDEPENLKDNEGEAEITAEEKTVAVGSSEGAEPVAD